MLDTSIFDRIIQTPGLAGHLRSLTAKGHRDVVVTQDQEDELARMTTRQGDAKYNSCRGA